MRARTGLWEPRGGNALGPPGPIRAMLTNGRRQQGHSLSMPLMSDMNAEGCGIVMIALKASGSRWA